MKNLLMICAFLVLNIVSIKANIIKTELIKGEIIFNIHYLESEPNDTLALYISNALMMLKGDRSNKYYKAARNGDGFFRFVIPVEESCGYLAICKKDKRDANHTYFLEMSSSHFWEVGDSIDINLSFKENSSGLGGEAVCSFKGIGAEKYNLVSELNQLRADPKGTLYKQKYLFNWSGNILENENFDRVFPIHRIKLKWLEEYKDRLSVLSYNVIKAGILYDQSSYLNFVVKFVKSGGFSALDSATKNRMFERFTSSHDYPNNYGISSVGLGNSIPYITFMINKNIAGSYLYTGGFSPEWIYDNIKKNSNKEIKETLIMNLLWVTKSSKNYNKIYENASNYITKKQYVRLYQDLRSRLSGDAVLDGILEDYYGKSKSLADFRNKVMLVDFWFTGCPGCAAYYKTVLSNTERNLIDNDKVVFVSISVDGSKAIWKKSVESGEYTSLKSVNLYTNGLGSKHPIISDYRIPAFPCVILVDKFGVIKFFNADILYNEVSLTAAIKELTEQIL